MFLLIGPTAVGILPSAVCLPIHLSVTPCYLSQVRTVNTDLQESAEKSKEQLEKQERTILALKCERDDLQREVDELQV